MDTKAVRRSMLCSEIVSLHCARPGRDATAILKANLEEIWSSGAIFRTDVRIRQHTSLWFVGGGFEFRGQVIRPEVTQRARLFRRNAISSGLQVV